MFIFKLLGMDTVSQPTPSEQVSDGAIGEVSSNNQLYTINRELMTRIKEITGTPVGEGLRLTEMQIEILDEVSIDEENCG